MRLRTHAKVNLYLRVAGRRPDGFHEIETILHGIDLADELEIEERVSGDSTIDMRLGSGTEGSIPAPHENLALRAVEMLAPPGATSRSVALKLTKNIPIGAGLGGGSGNAAGVLQALSELWEVDLEPEQLVDLAASIGSDVPYCLAGGTVLALGRGEKLARLPAPEGMWFVLGISNDPLMTKRVYEAWDGLETEEAPGSGYMTIALGSGDVEQVARSLHNDLERAAFSLRPELQTSKDAMLEAGAWGASLSGSGPTIYGVAGSRDEANEIAGAVAGVFDRVVVVTSKDECIERL